MTKGRAEAEASNLDMNYFLGIDATSGSWWRTSRRRLGSPGNHPVSGLTTVTSNVWHHAAATYDGSDLAAVPGRCSGRDARGGSLRLVVDSVQHAALGTAMTSAGVAAGFFAGALDEARIWNAARSATQIADSRDLELPRVPGWSAGGG